MTTAKISLHCILKAVKILAVFYVQFLRFKVLIQIFKVKTLSSKSLLISFYGNSLSIKFQRSIPSVYAQRLYFLQTTLTGCVDLRNVV